MLYMNNFISFEKFEKFDCFSCKDGGWQLSKTLGFHKCSPSRNYFVK